MGRVLISLELLPKALADKLPAGLGRGDPNTNPILPPPSGRLKFVCPQLTLHSMRAALATHIVSLVTRRR